MVSYTPQMAADLSANKIAAASGRRGSPAEDFAIMYASAFFLEEKRLMSLRTPVVYHRASCQKVYMRGVWPRRTA